MKTSEFIRINTIILLCFIQLHACAQSDKKDKADFSNQKENKSNTVEKDWTHLMYAIDDGNFWLAESIIEKGEKLNFENNRGYTPLMLAIDEEETEIVKLLLNKGVPINYKSKRGYTALNVACDIGNLDLVTLLLEKGSRVDTETTLMTAVSGKNSEVVQRILKEKVNLNATSQELHYCCTDSDEPSYKIRWTNWNPLLEAVHKNKVSIANLLLDNGTDIQSSATKTTHQFGNAEKASGWTALFEAIENSNVEMIQLLLKKGADKNAKLSTGQTALQFASELGNNAVISAIQK